MDVRLVDNLLDLMIPSEGDLLNDWGKHEEKLNTIAINIENLRNNLNYQDNLDNFANEITRLLQRLEDRKRAAQESKQKIENLKQQEEIAKQKIIKDQQDQIRQQQIIENQKIELQKIEEKKREEFKQETKSLFDDIKSIVFFPDSSDEALSICFGKLNQIDFKIEELAQNEGYQRLQDIFESKITYLKLHKDELKDRLEDEKNKRENPKGHFDQRIEKIRNLLVEGNKKDIEKKIEELFKEKGYESLGEYIKEQVDMLNDLLKEYRKKLFDAETEEIEDLIDKKKLNDAGNTIKLLLENPNYSSINVYLNDNINILKKNLLDAETEKIEDLIDEEKLNHAERHLANLSANENYKVLVDYFNNKINKLKKNLDTAKSKK